MKIPLSPKVIDAVNVIIVPAVPPIILNMAGPLCPNNSYGYYYEGIYVNPVHRK